MSANGSLFVMTSRDRLTGQDADNTDDVYVVDSSRRTVTLVSSGVVGDATCQQISPDARFVAFSVNEGTSDELIYVADTLVGSVTQVTEPAFTTPSTNGWIFSGMSDDGSRVAFVGDPTGRYLGPYSQPATRDPAVFVRDLPTGFIYNLSSEVVLRTNSLSDVLGQARITPDGQALAFTSDEDDPGTGDSNAGRADVFLIELDTGVTTLVSATASGGQAGFPVTFNPSLSITAFLDGGTRVAFFVPNASAFGPAGTYAKSLLDGSLELLFEDDFDIRRGANGPRLSFSSDGNAVAYLLRVNNTNLPYVEHIPSGQRVQLAGDTSLNVFLNSTANTVIFDTNDDTLATISAADYWASSSSVRVYGRRR